MMELRQGQSEREIKTLQQSEKEVTLLRHDMLHFLNNFSHTVNIPKDIFISDVDITSILSNALENALHAVLPLDSTLRIIELNMMQKGEKLLIRLSNSYAGKPQMLDGCPVAEQQGHGFGTKSIRYTVEKLHGNCLFSVNDERFVLQIIV